jgi:cytochrome c oxidase assembly protein subunit 15
MAAAHVRGRTGAVSHWLWSVAALVFLMVVVGGATRLTESGLSITEWKPVTGVIPPLGQAAWLEAFEKYKRIPQYASLFPDMTLGHFQAIFLMEWTHRLIGRLLGLALFAPLVVFWARGMLARRLKWQMAGIVALVGLQGFVGSRSRRSGSPRTSCSRPSPSPRWSGSRSRRSRPPSRRRCPQRCVIFRHW